MLLTLAALSLVSFLIRVKIIRVSLKRENWIKALIGKIKTVSSWRHFFVALIFSVVVFAHWLGVYLKNGEVPSYMPTDLTGGPNLVDLLVIELNYKFSHWLDIIFIFLAVTWFFYLYNLIQRALDDHSDWRLPGVGGLVFVFFFLLSSEQFNGMFYGLTLTSVLAIVCILMARIFFYSMRIIERLLRRCE
jgi:hypothetical protein